MANGKLIVILVVLFLVGVTTGYVLFSGFSEILLSKSSGKYTLIATEANEVLVTQVLFAIFIALAFVSVPVSALVSDKFSSTNLKLSRLVIFGIILILSISGFIFYYQNYFVDLATAMNSGSEISIKLDMIPYFRIPLLSAAITVAAGLLYLSFSYLKQRNH